MRMNRYGIYISWFILCIFVVDFLLLEEKKKEKIEKDYGYKL